MTIKTARRRNLLAAAALAAATAFAAVLLPPPCVARAAEPIPAAYRIGGWAIGCQAYSFNRYSVIEAIQKTADAGGKIIEFFPGQKIGLDATDARLGADTSDEAIAKIKDALAKRGVLAVSFGVVGLPANAVESRKVFAFAKKMGIRTIVTEPSENALDTIERLVKEYDIQVAIHNHPRQPNNPNYKVWDPNYVLSLVKNRDKRIGACADTGHWVRSGIKPVDALRILRGRVLELHLKDLHEFSPGGHDVPFGTGVSDIKGILDELRAQNFDGNLSIEYEYNWETSVPEVAQCVGFVRGYAAAAGTAARRR